MTDHMPNALEFLEEPYAIDTPENVSFGYEVAGIGSRFIGALVDSVILVTLLILVNLVLVMVLDFFPNAIGAAEGAGLDEAPDIVTGLIVAVYLLIQFAIIWGYYTLFELLWNGQTPGKWIAGVRVLRNDGGPAGGTEAAVRNLVRIIDFLPFAYGVGFLVMLANRQARRLGDLAAGTLVVHERAAIGLGEVRRMAARPPEPLAPHEAARSAALREQYPTVDRLTETDVAVIADALAHDRRHRLDPALLVRLARAVAAKLDCSAPADARRFLTEVMIAYRRAP